MLYLHEVIDIIGDGQQAYLHTVGAERAPHSEREGISRLVGTWRVIGSTNRWPRVVNLWEMDGWEHWAAALERQFLPEKTDAQLAPWWAAATKWRSGGFDRILEPAVFSPTRRQLIEESLTAWVCVHTTVRTLPGMRDAYLTAVDATLRPALARHHLTLMGAYSVPMRSDEVLLLWAAPDFRRLCALYGTRRDDGELRQWRQQAGALRGSFESMWIVPSIDCFFHPRHGETVRA